MTIQELRQGTLETSSIGAKTIFNGWIKNKRYHPKLGFRILILLKTTFFERAKTHLFDLFMQLIHKSIQSSWLLTSASICLDFGIVSHV